MSYNPFQSFNGRVGAVTLTYSDVTGALGFTPTTVAGAVSGVAAAAGSGLVTSTGTALSSIALPGGTSLFLRADGTFASPGAASMVYPGAGVAVSTGAAWGTSLTLATVATSGSAVDLTGNLAVARLNAGTAASSTTFWCGNGTWATPTVAINNDVATSTYVYPLFFTGTGSTGTLYQSNGNLRYQASTGTIEPRLLDTPAASTADLTAPASGFARRGARVIAGRAMPYNREPTGPGYPLGPDLSFRRMMQWQFGNGTTVTTNVAVTGSMPFTTVSPTAPAIITPNVAVPYIRGSIGSLATANSIAFTRVTTADTGCAVVGVPFMAVWRWGLGSGSALMSAFVGLVDTNAAPTVVNPTTTTTPGGMGCAIPVNDGSASAVWRIVNNRTGTARTNTTLTGAGYAGGALAFYEMVLWSDGTNFYWQIGTDNGIWATAQGFNLQINSGTFSAAALPAVGTRLYPLAWVTNNAGTTISTMQPIMFTLGLEA